MEIPTSQGTNHRRQGVLDIRAPAPNYVRDPVTQYEAGEMANMPGLDSWPPSRTVVAVTY